MAHCDEYLELISAAVDGALSPNQQEKLNAHLASCAECQRLFDDLLSLHAAIADLPPAEIPAGLKDRIMDAVAAEAENAKVLPFAPKEKKRSPIRWQRWLASAAVLALVVMGTWSWKPWESRADRPQAKEVTSDLGMDSASFTVMGTAGAADGAAPAAPAPQPSSLSAPADASAEAAAVPEPASAPLDAAPTADFTSENTEAPAEKNAVRSGKEAPSSDGGMVYGYAPGPQTADTFTAEGVPGAQAAPAGESSPLQVPAEAPVLSVAPRLFSAPAPSGAEDSQPTAAPRLFAASIPTPAGEGGGEQSVTSQEQAVNVLANYIYEFVDTVEPVDDTPDVYTISSPTGVSGTVTCLGEFEPAFLLDYQESLSDQVFHYSVSRSTGEVFLLGQEELSEPT